MNGEAMYPAKDARELAILLRISRELDVVGDVTATVDNPSELLAWALILAHPQVLAWRATDSGHRYLQVSAHRKRAPIRGNITAVLDGEQHADYWAALELTGLTPGDRRELGTDALSSAWATMPLIPENAGQAAPPQPPNADSA
ncbi:MAG TPA: hypothetical protein VFJ19_16940 [Nocardioidaceae bacterium]|nr:hypothetical protein [Nocardioidaceae bacterium]